MKRSVFQTGVWMALFLLLAWGGWKLSQTLGTEHVQATEHVQTAGYTQTAEHVQASELPDPRTPSSTFAAVIKPNRVCTLAFRVGGSLSEVCAHVGDTLHAGNALLRLDAQDFERDVKLATAKLQAAREQLALLEHGARAEDLAIIEAKLASAIAERDYTVSEYERVKPLLKKNAISLSDLDLLYSKVRIAEASVRSLEQELQKAQSGGRQEEICIQKAEIAALEVKLAEAEALLADTTLTVPFDGVLAECLAQPHEIVRPGHAVATLVDVSRFAVEIQIPESEIPQTGDFSSHFRGWVTFSSFPEQRYPVSFQQIRPNADAQTHRWLVTLTLEAPSDHVVLPGMTAKVQLENAKVQLEDTKAHLEEGTLEENSLVESTLEERTLGESTL